MLRYKIDVLWELKMRGYNTARIREQKIFGGAIMKCLRENEMIGIHAIDRVCGLLGMQPGDIIEYVPEEMEICSEETSEPSEYDVPLFAAAPFSEGEIMEAGDENAEE